MNWINIQTSTLRSPEFIGSSPAERAAWLCVLAYCTEQESGGRIVGSSTWKDRQWQQVCGVTRREINAASKLLHFDGDDLVCLFYPHTKEVEVKERRDAGRRGGLAKAKQNPSSASAVIQQDAATEGEGEGEGERKEKEKGIISLSIPRDADEALAYSKTQQGWTDDQTRAWFADRASQGWVKGNGLAVTNWRADLESWQIRSASGNAPSSKFKKSQSESQRDSEKTGLKTQTNLRHL